MEEPKNLNNIPANQPKAAAPNNISTMVGASIVLIVAVIIGAGIVYFFQADFFGSSYGNNQPVPIKSLKAQTETVATKENGTAPQGQAETGAATEEAAQPAIGITFDFDYELKKLDDQNNVVNPDDFNETEMADVNIGL